MARWHQNSCTTWILKEPSYAGGAVLATIEALDRERYRWTMPAGAAGISASLYAAQRAVRKALRAG